MHTSIRLTPREADVLQLLAMCHTYDGVSGCLGVSRNTVASHFKNIYRKLRVHSARCAIWRALELRMIGETEFERSVPDWALKKETQVQLPCIS